MDRLGSRPLTWTAAALAASLALPALPGVAAASTAPPTAGRTYVVTSTADAVDADVGAPACSDARHRCTLRAAIMQANFHPGADVIKIPAGVYTLTRKGVDDQDVLGDLDVTDSVTLAGAGRAKTIIDGNAKVTGDRVLQVLPGATDTTITGLTIRHGKVVGTFATAGGLLWQGSGASTLVMNHVVISGSRAYDAGGASLSFANTGNGDLVKLNHVTVQHNRASAAVGGLDVELGPYGTFLLRNSRILANTAYEGGGLYLAGPSSPNEARSIRVEHTLIEGNQAGLSGGIETWAGTKNVPVVITSTYIHLNKAAYQGGGIGNHGVLDLDRSTLQSNSSPKGGAMYDYAGALATLTNDTLSRNSAPDTGGAVYLEYFSGEPGAVGFRSTTLSGNTSPTVGGVYAATGSTASFANSVVAGGSAGVNCSGVMAALTSLSSDDSCDFGAGDGVTHLGLGPIGMHGGTTPTLVPQPASPVLDVGTSAGAPATDQRGIARPMGTGVDIGAVEVCPRKPAAPKVLAPRTKAKGPHLTLDWTDVACVQTYSVGIRRGSRTGKLVEARTGLLVSTLRTKRLVKGRTYYWRVAAVADRGKTLSSWHHVTVK